MMMMMTKCEFRPIHDPLTTSSATEQEKTISMGVKCQGLRGKTWKASKYDNDDDTVI